jgi:hypothetical protein
MFFVYFVLKKGNILPFKCFSVLGKNIYEFLGI